MATRKIFFDGGCRPNPGMMEIAVVVAGEAHVLRDIGPGSNEDAEWLALIHALRIAQERGETDFILIGDSADVIAKASGAIACRGASVAHHASFRALAGEQIPRLRHVRRAQNLAGIALNRAHPR